MNLPMHPKKLFLKASYAVLLCSFFFKYTAGAEDAAAGSCKDSFLASTLSASSTSKRTLVPALDVRLWYSPHLEFPNGMVLKGATLVAIKPIEQSKREAVGFDVNWVASAFEEPFGTAVRMLVKRRTYCLEMNSL